MPLSMSPAGAQAVVREIHAKEEVRRFLTSLGFVEGSPVTVVSELGGSLIVNIKDTRVALSRGMASKIMV